MNPILEIPTPLVVILPILPVVALVVVVAVLTIQILVAMEMTC